MKYKNLFWGLLLILLGVAYLLKQFGVVYFNWRDVISLWPMLLVLLGISILPIKAFYKLITSFVAIAVMALIIYFNPGQWQAGWTIWIGNHYQSEKNDVKESFYYDDGAEYALLELDAVAGSYTIEGTTDNLFDFTHIGDSGTYYNQTTSHDNYQHIKIGPETKNNQFNTYRNHQVEIKLNEETIWNIDIDAGAAEIMLDLTPFIVNKLTINGGAASVEVILGDRADSLNVKIETGVSAVVVKVPKHVACEVNTDSFLVSKELPDFDKVSKSTYVSPNFSSAEKNIYIKFEAGISSFEVVRY